MGVWGYNSIDDEAADEAQDAYANEGYEQGFNMDDGADPDEQNDRIKHYKRSESAYQTQGADDARQDSCV